LAIYSALKKKKKSPLDNKGIGLAVILPREDVAHPDNALANKVDAADAQVAKEAVEVVAKDAQAKNVLSSQIPKFFLFLTNP